VAGRIRDEDIALVRERSAIADVVGERVTLRNTGGSLMGLCPFHEERTPSFHVTPARGLFYCFSCNAGGDVFEFLMRLDHLSFTEAVEQLAARAGIQLRYVEGGYTARGQGGQRTRLLEAHRLAAEFYAAQLATPEAKVGREFLAARGFDEQAWRVFAVGYARQDWDALTRHLRGRGFTDKELIIGGLAREGQRGPIDRFRGRLVWPIRDIAGDVVGFGARRLYEDDTGPKYLNTPETPLYKKSQVLYGVDLAKREIARRMRAVVVEGYTDVMACHLAGVPTAVATCGTAFGGDHIRILRRLLMDQNEFRGEVIFTFDGDEAGQKAAMRAFADEQRFVAQTYVAVEPTGLDPCELRLAHGDAAVRDLVARRVPLFEFAIRSTLQRYDLDTAEGRVGALRAAAPVVASIRDKSLRPEYTRSLAGWLGMEVEAVSAAVGSAGQATVRNRSTRRPPEPGAGEARPGIPRQQGPRPNRPDPADPALQVEREALKLAIQRPDLGAGTFADATADLFQAAAYASVREAIRAAGGTGAVVPGGDWVTRLREAAADDDVRTLVTELAVEPLRHDGEADERYADAVYARLLELAATRRITELKSKLQRLSPVDATPSYNKLFGELIALEAHRRELRERAIGGL
jgi:DNA primase